MSTPTLLGYLAQWALAPVKKKGLLSGQYVLFAEYLSQAQLLYETGAVLGYIYRDRLETFAELFSEPGRQADLAYFLTTATSVADRLASLPDEPKNFYELFFKSEVGDLMSAMRNAGLTQFSGWLDFPKVSKLKMPIKYYFERLRMTALEGIQLGSQHAQFAEKLFTYEYDAEKWRFFYDLGLDIGESPPVTMPLSERQAEAKELIRAYVEEVRPDLLTKLEL